MHKLATPWLLAAFLTALGCGSGPTGTLIVGDDDDAAGDDDDSVGDDDDSVGDDDDSVGDDDDDGAPSFAGIYLGGMTVFGPDGDEFCDGEACLEVTGDRELIGFAECGFGGGPGGGNEAVFELTGEVNGAGEVIDGLVEWERFGEVSSYPMSGSMESKTGDEIELGWEMQFGGGGGGFDVFAAAWGARVADLDSCEQILGDDDDDDGGPGGGPGAGVN